MLDIKDKGPWEGTIKKILFSGNNDFSIVILKLKSSGEVTASGCIPFVTKGMNIKVTGSVKYNEKYKSNQIHIKTAIPLDAPKDIGAIRFMSDAVKGLSDAMATDIVEKYGIQFDDILTDKEKLLEISGIGQKNVIKIMESYQANKHLFGIYNATNGGVTLNQANKFYSACKDKAVSIIKEDPYQLIYLIDGIGFKKADAIALKSGISLTSPKRILAGAVHALKEASSSDGDLYLPIDMLLPVAASTLLSVKEIKTVFYQDVLKVRMADITPEWDTGNLNLYIKEHEKMVNNLIERWDDEKFRLSKIKEIKMSDEEVEALSCFVKKRNTIKESLKDVLIKGSVDVSGLSFEEIQDALQSNKNKFLVIETHNDNIRCFEKYNYLNELEAACEIKRLISEGPLTNISTANINKAILQVERENGVSLNQEQKDGIFMALTNRVSVLTGGPGRGKTTVIRAAVLAWRIATNLDVALMAPTGKAAKRMTEASGYEAKTIHRSIYNYNNKPDFKTVTKALVFVDEASMMDAKLIRDLLYKTKNCQICFVGDENQLPSVGAGNCLHDVITSNVVPVTRLVSCYRNSGSILNNTDKILNGCRVGELETDTHSNQLWVQGEATDIQKNALNIYKRFVPDYGVENMIVLSPMRKGPSGVLAMNQTLQDSINPKDTKNKPEVKLPSGSILRLGDRVIQNRNNYKLPVTVRGESSTGVFNGETGTITAVNLQDKELTVTFDDGKIGTYDIGFIDDDLSLGYALTYHKSQGSEYDFVICLMSKGDFLMQQRKIIYTGASRAKKKCIMIGHAFSFQMAIDNRSKAHERLSTLSERLQS